MDNQSTNSRIQCTETTATGGAVYDSNYVPFGPDQDESGSEEFKYTGKHQDATGLYYFGARYYDPETGRFITEDLVKGKLSDPQSLNQYAYCRNNPYKYVDPDGKIAIQIGYGGSAGLLPIGYCVSQGIAISIDWSGIEIGTYTEIGEGSYFGGGAGMAPKVTMTPNAKSLCELGGESVSIQVSVAIPAGKLGLGCSAPIEGIGLDLSNPSFSMDLPILSFGAEAKMSAHVTKTVIHNKWVIKFPSKQVTNPVNIPNETLYTNSQLASEWDAYDKYKDEVFKTRGLP